MVSTSLHVQCCAAELSSLDFVFRPPIVSLDQPKHGYFLRCIAPVCIEDEASRFDQRMMDAAMDKLGLNVTDRGERTVELLRRRLCDGGSALTIAAHTSPAAFLGSLAACHKEPAFAPYCGATGDRHSRSSAPVGSTQSQHADTFSFST